MTTSTAPRPAVAQRVSAWFFHHPRLRLALALGPVVAWLGVVYLGSLASLLFQSLWRLDSFTGQVVQEIGLSTLRDVFTEANRAVVVRTFAMAAAVTVTCAIFAYPLAYYMARVASARAKAALYVLVLMPLWSSYLVRVYSWRIILDKEGLLDWTTQHLGLQGVLNWLLDRPGIGGTSLAFSTLGLYLVFVYIWLPYMILPLQAALERIPRSYVEASADLGGHPALTFRKVIFPLALPGMIAGSIFTFALTLGDFIAPDIIGDGRPFIGTVVYVSQGVSGNVPFAAAFSIVPIVIMAAYLTIARRLGAFESL